MACSNSVGWPRSAIWTRNDSTWNSPLRAASFPFPPLLAEEGVELADLHAVESGCERTRFMTERGDDTAAERIGEPPGVGGG